MTQNTHHSGLPRFLWPLAVLNLLLAPMLALIVLAAPLHAAERGRVEAFLNVTGFDVALDSIALTASNAPAMLGMPVDEFGDDWKRLAGQVFDTDVMRGIALDILEATLSDDALTHAAGFYATDLGQRLVEAENASHLDGDTDAKQQQGREIVAGLVESGSGRLELIKRMNLAVNASGSSVLALQEIQIRFLLAADAAGVIKLKVDADGLRAMMKSQEPGMRLSIQKSALAGAAFTYRYLSDDDIDAYAGALEQPLMRQVYELLNAVQYEIMAMRFEILATRMADLHPSQDI